MRVLRRFHSVTISCEQLPTTDRVDPGSSVNQRNAILVGWIDIRLVAQECLLGILHRNCYATPYDCRISQAAWKHPSHRYFTLLQHLHSRLQSSCASPHISSNDKDI